MSDLLVRGGTVLDGLGSPGRRADVRVRGGRVAEVGRDLRPDGESEIDATGAYVAPGFIDTHTHFDASMFWDPACDQMPQHGVTSVLIGNCSLSLAPARPEYVQEVASVFSFVEDLPMAAFDEAVPWAWSTYREYRDALRARGGYGVNVAALVGHTPLRLYVMGPEAWERPATADERSAMAGVLADSLDAGAFGLSTSFFDTDPAGRDVPSKRADDDEMGALLDVLASRGRFLQFVPDIHHDGFFADVERMGRLAGPRGVTVTWNGLFDNEQRPGWAKGLMDRCGEMQAAGQRVVPMASPRGLDVRVNWLGGLSFYRLTDAWYPLIQAPVDEKRRMIADPDWRARARHEWDTVIPRTFFRPDRLDLVRLTEVTRPENERWLGKTLEDLVADRGGHPSDVLADWVLDNDCTPGTVAMGVQNGDPAAVAEMLRHPAGVVSNSDAGAHLQMFAAAGDTTLLLARHVRDRGDMTVEEAVHALTGRQADLFGFADRGVLRPGAVGDVTVFDLDRLRWLPESFGETPLPGGGKALRRPDGGYRATLVAGRVVQADDRLTGELPGTVLDAG